MNRNHELESTVTTIDGRTVVLRHRNSIGGWIAALERAGLTLDDIDDIRSGRVESSC